MKQCEICLLLVGVILFSMGTVSAAWNWDNSKDYDEDSKTITITNAFGLGGDIAEINLTTPQVYYVMPGQNRLVAEFTIKNLDEYSKVFNDMDFYDIKNDYAEFDRDFTYKYKAWTESEVPNYVTVCETFPEKDSKNGSIYESCITTQQGTRTEKNFEWQSLDTSLLAKGNIEVGIFTDVYQDDYVEWIPTLFGVRINEWAVWTSSFNTGLVMYFTLNESSGDAVERVSGNWNGTVEGATRDHPGIINSSYNFDGTNDRINLGNVTNGTISGIWNFTLNLWVNTSLATQTYVIYRGGTTVSTVTLLHRTGGKADLTINTESDSCYTNNTAAFNDEGWHMLTAWYNGSNPYIYLDGVPSASEAAGICTGGVLQNAGDNVTFGAESDMDADWTGKMDEIAIWNRTLSDAEILDLYNSGKGLTYSSTGVTDLVTDTFNATTHETMTENFLGNFTQIKGVSVSSANLIWNSVAYTGTVSGNITSAQIQIPEGTGGKTFYWSATLANGTIYNSSSETQTVNLANFTNCYATGGNVFLNLTFQDEADESAMNGTIDSSTWYYWLGDGTVNKSYTFTNTSTNADFFKFCFSPADKTLNYGTSLQYAYTGYPARRWEKSGTLTNTTTEQTLYQLATADGSYATYQVQTSNGNPIGEVDVTAERKFSGVYKIVEQGETGGDGAVTFWLNPDYDHRLVFTKSGYVSVTLIHRPSQSTYTVTMDTTSQNATYSSVSEGITWVIWPASGRLDKTTTTFGFNVSTVSGGTMTDCNMSLLDINDTVLNSTSGCTSGGGNISLTFDPSAYDKIWGQYEIYNGSNWFIVDSDAMWVIENVTSAEGTIWRAINRMKDLDQFGKGSNKQEYSRIIMFFLVLTIILGFLAYSTGWDFATAGGSIFLLTAVIWIASFAGFLELSNLSARFDIVNKYYVALISTFLAVGYGLNKWRREA